MAISNHERIGKALELLNEGLKTFVENEMKSAHGEKWKAVAFANQHDDRNVKKKASAGHWDTQALLSVMWSNWNPVFGKTLSPAERSLVSELRDVRNRWAHQETFNSDDTYRYLDSMERLLTAVSSANAGEMGRQKTEVMRLKFDEQARWEKRKITQSAIEGTPKEGLKPWREIITPHPDVASGKYQQAEFAADLWEVYLKGSTDEYRDPHEFFRRTFLTEGLQSLLVNALRRLGGNGGDPVIEMQTNFGGGKTHSLLALYHLFSGVKTQELPGVESILSVAGVKNVPKTRRAVFVGNKIPPSQPHKKEDGTIVRTVWGEIAWQLGGKEGYEFVKKADETGTNPGDELKKLFNKFAPCLILIDEWVAYARQLHDGVVLPAGTFDAQFTFAQALTEAAKNAKNTLLVVSVPASGNEIGGEWGRKALDGLKNAIGRVESPWRPASVDEGFEIVRRRLFQPIADPKLMVARDTVVKSFSEFYRENAAEFPSECREAAYERRMKAAYPIHPELFDRLFNDWSSLEKFQRTRGVLRLMAKVIHYLWEMEDKSLAILPAHVPVALIEPELGRYLEERWAVVINSDIDGENSLPLQIDRENPNMGRIKAAQRVGRTIFMGSAPTVGTAHKGLEDRQIKLGSLQPGESIGTVGDALRRLSDKAKFLYVDGHRYWYSTQPSLTSVAEDRAAQCREDMVFEEIKSWIRDEAEVRGDFDRVHAAPASSADVPDEREARLVIFGPEQAHNTGNTESTARLFAADILNSRGTVPRYNRNAVVMLAADRSRMEALVQAVRSYLAWDSIYEERGEKGLNLDPQRAAQAERKREEAKQTIKARIPETFIWLFVPVQPKADSPMSWQEIRLSGGGSLAERAAKKLRGEGLLMVNYGPTVLRHDLDTIPLWNGNHVELSTLADHFSQYVYLPRLKSTHVLSSSIMEGLALTTWQVDSFAFADSWDEAVGRYRGLRAGALIDLSLDTGLLVKPDVAVQQLEQEKPGEKPAATETGSQKQGDKGAVSVPKVQPKVFRRFHGSVTLSPDRIGRDAGTIAEEVVQHLSTLRGSNVEVTLEVTASLPDGAPDNVVRTVTENCRSLRFKTSGFEEA